MFIYEILVIYRFRYISFFILIKVIIKIELFGKIYPKIKIKFELYELKNSLTSEKRGFLESRGLEAFHFKK